MESYQSYETERLILRPTTVQDAAFIYELLNTPKWMRYVGDRHIHNEEDAREYIKVKMYPQLERLGHSNFTVIRKEDRVKIGSTGLYDREGMEGLDMGFAYLPDYEKKGYAFEAANKLKQVAFEELKITELSAITLEENTSSRALLGKLGFKLVGPIRIPNDDADLLLYKLYK